MDDILIIEELKDKEVPPYDLLYMADPSQEAVKDYIGRGICFVASTNNKVIGVYVLLQTRPFTVELVNVAIAEEYRGQGYGKRLVAHAIDEAQRRKFHVLEVGTGNAGIKQLSLYQKSGFTITSVDFDFFRKHYPEPIWEDGIECRHMIRMSMDLINND